MRLSIVAAEIALLSCSTPLPLAANPLAPPSLTIEFNNCVTIPSLYCHDQKLSPPGDYYSGLVFGPYPSYAESWAGASLSGLSQYISLKDARPIKLSAPSIYASVENGGLINGMQATSAFARSRLGYQVEVVGPPGWIDLGYTLSGLNEVMSSSMQVGASFTLTGFNVFSDYSSNACDICYNYMIGGYSITREVLVEVNSPLNVSMEASAWTGYSPSYWGGTYLDPSFFIPSGVIDPSLYSIVLSPGVANGVATPELPTWAMLAFAFAGLGLAGWGRSGRLVRCSIPSFTQRLWGRVAYQLTKRIWGLIVIPSGHWIDDPNCKYAGMLMKGGVGTHRLPTGFTGIYRDTCIFPYFFPKPSARPIDIRRAFRAIASAWPEDAALQRCDPPEEQ